MGKGHVYVKPMQRAALARATGCNLDETIRYYETVGVMPDPRRIAPLSQLDFIRRAEVLHFLGRSAPARDDRDILLELMENTAGPNR